MSNDLPPSKGCYTHQTEQYKIIIEEPDENTVNIIYTNFETFTQWFSTFTEGNCPLVGGFYNFKQIIKNPSKISVHANAIEFTYDKKEILLEFILSLEPSADEMKKRVMDKWNEHRDDFVRYFSHINYHSLVTDDKYLHSINGDFYAMNTETNFVKNTVEQVTGLTDEQIAKFNQLKEIRQEYLSLISDIHLYYEIMCKILYDTESHILTTIEDGVTSVDDIVTMIKIHYGKEENLFVLHNFIQTCNIVRKIFENQTDISCCVLEDLYQNTNLREYIAEMILEHNAKVIPPKQHKFNLGKYSEVFTEQTGTYTFNKLTVANNKFNYTFIAEHFGNSSNFDVDFTIEVKTNEQKELMTALNKLYNKAMFDKQFAPKK